MTFTLRITGNRASELYAKVEGLSQKDSETLVLIARGMMAKVRTVTCACGTVFETSRPNRIDCTVQCGTNRRVKAHRERKARLDELIESNRQFGWPSGGDE